MSNLKPPCDSAFVLDKARLKDVMGRYLTRSLFLEMDYNTDLAVYTLSDTDKCHNGVLYPSLRRLYLETEDPTEYAFATTYLWGWEHWQRILQSPQLIDEIEKWREELDIKLRSRGIVSMIKAAKEGNGMSQWLAKGGYNEKKRGRPSKEDKARQKAAEEKADKELQDDANRILNLVKK